MYFARHCNTSLIEIEETEAAKMNENSKRVTRTGWLIVANMTPVFAYSGQAGYQLTVSWYS